MINWEIVNKITAKTAMLGQSIVVGLFLLVLLSTSIETKAQSQIQGSRDNTQVYSGVVYGPIDQNDTLWRIASRYKQDAQFTVYQTMLAIFELNPQAFENSNFNTMVNGATLQLPSDRYIARVDPQKARAKADVDAKAVGRPSSGNKTSSSANQTPADASTSSANLKPEIPLVNQEDLSKTSSQLQEQLNKLRQQQQQQFLLLKNQVASSINSVETLLQENKKLNEQLVKIDENNRNLTQKVESELQIQIDDQVNQLGQLIALVKDAEQRRIDKESQSIFQILSTPLAIIILMSSVTLLLILGLAFFLLRKPAQAPTVVEVETPITETIDDELVIGEVDDVLDQDSEDLMAALSEDDDLEEDDILSDALEDDESLNILTNEDMEAELDGLDDMLVPDSPPTTTDDDSFGEDFDFENGAISLDDDDDFLLDEDEVETSTAGNEQSEPSTKTASDIDKTQSIETSSSEDADAAPSGINLDENGDINDNTLEQIGNQIEEKDQTITRMTDELLDELDNVPSDSADIDELVSDNALEPSTTTDTDEPSVDADEDIGMSEEALLGSDDEEVSSNEELDALLDSIDDDALDLELGDELDLELDDDLDSLLGESSDNSSVLSTEESEGDQISVLADELINELENENTHAKDNEQQIGEKNNVAAQDTQNYGDSESTDPQKVEVSTAKTERILDADDLLDDIPSFTSGLSDDQDDEQEDIKSEVEAIIEKPPVINKPAELANENKTVEKQNTTDDKLDDVTGTPEVNPANKADNQLGDIADLETESDEDVLSGLSGLDNWLDEEDEAQLVDIAQAEKNSELDLSALELDGDELDSLSNLESDENDLIQGLDEADFDDMLNDLADDNNSISTTETISPEKSNRKWRLAKDEPIGNADVDIDALMASKDSLISDLDSTKENDFVDVDDLLKESEAIASLSDDEVEFNLDSSLSSLTPNQNDINANSNSNNDSDNDNNQSSNLDLAQVYMDMEDYAAAKELLEEVASLGSKEQQDEANALLKELK